MKKCLNENWIFVDVQHSLFIRSQEREEKDGGASLQESGEVIIQEEAGQGSEKPNCKGKGKTFDPHIILYQYICLLCCIFLHSFHPCMIFCFLKPQAISPPNFAPYIYKSHILEIRNQPLSVLTKIHWPSSSAPIQIIAQMISTTSLLVVDSDILLLHWNPTQDCM